MKKSLTHRLWIFLCPFCLLCLTIVSAHATLVATSFEGTVTEDNGGSAHNPFGLSIGDTIYGSAIYDDAVVATDPDGQFDLDSYTGWSFSITLGSFTLNQSNVDDPTYTNFWFLSGFIDGIEFFKEDFAFGGFDNLLAEDDNGGQSLFVEEFDPVDPDYPIVYLEADWDFENATTPAPVPEPGTLLLLGTGLAVVVRFRKKFKRS